ncbi:DUF6799 domain-containing protein [Hymenobacter daeguensis]
MKSTSLFRGLLGIFLLGSVVAQGQTARPGRVQPKPRVAASAVEGTKDGLSMVKGRVVLTELGISNPLTADKKLINGTVITPAGVVTTPDGTATQIAEGDHVSLTGRVTTRKAIADADSIAKVQLFDAKYPGKREKMEKEKAKKDKEKAKREEEKAKAKAKLEKAKADRMKKR